MSTRRTLPETWKTRDGRVLLIREMSDDHIRNTLVMLKNMGVMSMREWQDERPQWATGLTGEFAQDAAEQSYYDELETWARKKHSAHVDAFHLEMAFRRRHGIRILEKQLEVGETVDATPPAAPVRVSAWTLARDPEPGDLCCRWAEPGELPNRKLESTLTREYQATVLEIKASPLDAMGRSVLMVDCEADQILVPMAEFRRYWAYIPPAT
jgi:hypothetical protein